MSLLRIHLPTPSRIVAREVQTTRRPETRKLSPQMEMVDQETSHRIRAVGRATAHEMNADASVGTVSTRAAAAGTGIRPMTVILTQPLDPSPIAPVVWALCAPGSRSTTVFIRTVPIGRLNARTNRITRKTVKELEVTMNGHKYDGKDPIKVISFLRRLKRDADRNDITECTLYLALS